MKDFNRLREQVVRGLESFRTVAHIPEEYLAFRTGLYHGQLAVYDALSQVKAQSQFPLKPGSVTVDPDILERLLKETSAVLAQASPMKKELNALADKPDNLSGIVQAAAFGPDLSVLKKKSDELSISDETLLFFGRACAAPYVSRIIWPAAENAGELSDQAGGCPYCGSLPGLSILRGEIGQRLLVCSLCGMEWNLSRLKCPFCGADSSLEIISEGKSAPRWIESCASCRSYIKTVDERKLGRSEELIPLLEAVSTLYMDFIAEKQGLKRSLPYAAIR